MKKLFAILALALVACNAPTTEYTPEEPPIEYAAPEIIAYEPEPTPEPEPEEDPIDWDVPYEERVTTLTNEAGGHLDEWIFSLDGERQLLPLDAVFRGGRMYTDAAYFALAMGLPVTESTESIEAHIFELTEAHGLFAYFHHANGTLELFTGHERPARLPAAGEGDAIMRLEDVIATNAPYHDRAMLRRRAIADLLYAHGAAFTIAWVPVNVRPAEDFRHDSRDYTRYNVEFIFTMDYWVSRGGQMGLHGYTHQMGNQNSVAGHEFGGNVSDERARELFENMLEAANHFGWTPYSFTFPKYIGTDRQFFIAGEYFDFIMPNFAMRGHNTPRREEINGRQVIYMNATEDHLFDQGAGPLNQLLGRLNRAGEIASFYIHTWLEYRYIEVTRNEQNRPVITHDENSPMHQILENLRQNGRVLRPTTHFSE